MTGAWEPLNTRVILAGRGGEGRGLATCALVWAPRLGALRSDPVLDAEAGGGERECRVRRRSVETRRRVGKPNGTLREDETLR